MKQRYVAGWLAAVVVASGLVACSRGGSVNPLDAQNSSDVQTYRSFAAAGNVDGAMTLFFKHCQPALNFRLRWCEGDPLSLLSGDPLAKRFGPSAIFNDAFVAQYAQPLHLTQPWLEKLVATSDLACRQGFGNPHTGFAADEVAGGRFYEEPPDPSILFPNWLACFRLASYYERVAHDRPRAIAYALRVCAENSLHGEQEFCADARALGADAKSIEAAEAANATFVEAYDRARTEHEEGHLQAWRAARDASNAYTDAQHARFEATQAVVDQLAAGISAMPGNTYVPPPVLPTTRVAASQPARGATHDGYIPSPPTIRQPTTGPIMQQCPTALPPNGCVHNFSWLPNGQCVDHLTCVGATGPGGASGTTGAIPVSTTGQTGAGVGQSQGGGVSGLPPPNPANYSPGLNGCVSVARQPLEGGPVNVIAHNRCDQAVLVTIANAGAAALQPNQTTTFSSLANEDNSVAVCPLGFLPVGSDNFSWIPPEPYRCWNGMR